MHSGLIKIFIYPTKYLKEPFKLYESLLNITILSISTFLLYKKFFGILSVFVYFLQTYFDIYFFHALLFYLFLR